MFDGPLSTPALHWIATTACFLLLGAAITIGVSKALVHMPLNAGVSPKILRTAKSCSLNRAQGGGFPVMCLPHNLFLLRATNTHNMY